MNLNFFFFNYFVDQLYSFFSKNFFFLSFKSNYWFTYWRLVFSSNKLTSLKFYYSEKSRFLYFSSSPRNQRFFFIMQSLLKTHFSFSVGTVLKKNDVLDKYLRNSSQGLFFFFKFILNILKEDFSNFFLFFFYGFVTKFFFFFSKFVNSFFFSKESCFFFFSPKVSFYFKKYKKYKAIKKSYRRSIKRIESRYYF